MQNGGKQETYHCMCGGFSSVSWLKFFQHARACQGKMRRLLSQRKRPREDEATQAHVEKEKVDGVSKLQGNALWLQIQKEQFTHLVFDNDERVSLDKTRAQAELVLPVVLHKTLERVNNIEVSKCNEIGGTTEEQWLKPVTLSRAEVLPVTGTYEKVNSPIASNPSSPLEPVPSPTSPNSATMQVVLPLPQPLAISLKKLDPLPIPQFQSHRVD